MSKRRVCTCDAVRELDEPQTCEIHDLTDDGETFNYQVAMRNVCGYCGQDGHDRLQCPNRDPESFLS